MKLLRFAIALTAVTCLLVPVAAQNLEADLQRAVQREQASGDPKAAIAEYQRIVDRASSNPAVAAKALLLMAAAYENLGSSLALATYERVITEFAGQPKLAAEASVQLGRLRAAAAAPITARANAGPRLVGTSAGRLSRDEKTMVFVQFRDVAVRDMATGNTTQLTVTPAVLGRNNRPEPSPWANSPVLSPDSKQIAYGEVYPSGGAEFRLMANEVGAIPRGLFRNPEFRYVSPQAWSPDGKAVLVALLKVDRTWQLAWISTVGGSITGLESLEWRFDDEYDKVNLSPDGRYIVYSALAKNPAKPLSIEEQASLERRVFILASDGSSRAELSGSVNGRKPVWSADGGHVVFISDLGSNLGLWSIPVRGGKAVGTPSNVRANIERDINPIAISRTGTLYYSRWTTGYGGFAVADVDMRAPGGGDRMVGWGPGWSPDGSAVAFFRHKPDPESDNNLVIHSFKTREDMLFSNLAMGGRSPLWFHDGRRLLVEARTRAGGWTSYAVDLRSGRSTEILPADPRHGPVIGLSADDVTAYYLLRESNSPQNGFDRLMAIDLATNESRQVFSFSSLSRVGPVTGSSTVLSPDGKTVALQTSNDNETHLGLVSLEDGRYRELHRGPKVTTRGLQWVNGGQALAWGEPLAGDTPARGRMMRIPVVGGRVEFTRIEYEDDRVPSISPDGSRAARPFNVPNMQELWALDNVTSSPTAAR